MQSDKGYEVNCPLPVLLAVNAASSTFFWQICRGEPEATHDPSGVRA